MQCEYCQGDRALWYKDSNNCTFVDSHGEILALVNGAEIRFKVQHCPKCGQRLDMDVYTHIRKGNIVYYVDEEYGEVERGEIFSVHFKDGLVDSLSINFSNGDFDEFYGTALGKCIFLTREEADAVLIKGQTY